MQPLDLLKVFLDPLERAGFSYMVTGSVAAIFHGAPRVTHDVDLVLEIETGRAAALAALFPDSDFYCPPLETLEAEISRRDRGHFNLIHHASGFKADLYPARDWLAQWGMERRLRFQQEATTVWVAPAEYVILRKLEYYREGGSEKHLSDIQKMLAVEGEKVDLDWIESKAAEFGLEGAWKRIRPNPRFR